MFAVWSPFAVWSCETCRETAGPGPPAPSRPPDERAAHQPHTQLPGPQPHTGHSTQADPGRALWRSRRTLRSPPAAGGSRITRGARTEARTGHADAGPRCADGDAASGPGRRRGQGGTRRWTRTCTQHVCNGCGARHHDRAESGSGVSLSRLRVRHTSQPYRMHIIAYMGSTSFRLQLMMLDGQMRDGSCAAHTS